MNYTYTQLARVPPQSYRRQVWLARASRLWKRYLRVAAAIASVLGTAVLTIIYFVVLPPFAWLAKRAATARAASAGRRSRAPRDDSPTGQY